MRTSQRRPVTHRKSTVSLPLPLHTPASSTSCRSPLLLLGYSILLLLLLRLAMELRVFLPASRPTPELRGMASSAAAAVQPGVASSAAAAVQPPPHASAGASSQGSAAASASLAAGASSLGSTASALSSLMLRSDSPAGSAVLHALNEESFNLVTIERTEALRSRDRMCQGPHCTGQKFFLVEQGRESSDKVLGFLFKQELRVMEVFTTLLSSTSCAGILPGGATPWCAHQHPLGLGARPPPTVLDLGSNSGFYTQLSARAGAQVLAVDPQPHCLQYVRIAATLNGLPSRVHTLNAFASPAAAAAAAATATRTVPLRTGCWGMFPHDRGLYASAAEDPHPATRAEYNALQGGNASVAVPLVSVAELVAQLSAEAGAGGAGEEGVLLAKIDAEGSEVALVGALAEAGLLASHAIKSFLLEANKYALHSEGPPCLDRALEAPMGAAPCYAAMLQQFQSAGYKVMVHEPWSGSEIENVTAFAYEPWRTVDLWVAVPR